MSAPTTKGSAPEDTKQSGSGKREDYLKWEEYFMSLAFLSGKRSKDPNRQVGACIVNDQKRIIGLGYNGMPDRVSDDDMPWAHGSENEDELKTKTPYVCHAELNAVMNKIQADSRGCTMYVSLFPCNQCAKIIIQAGIRDVVYYSDEKAGKKETQAAKVLFDKAGVDYWRYDKDNKGLRTTVEIEFK